MMWSMQQIEFQEIRSLCLNASYSSLKLKLNEK